MAAGYDKLYIHELKGVAGEELFAALGGFIGVWVEDGHSYVFLGEDRRAEVESRARAAGGLEYLSETAMDYADWEAGREVTHRRVGRFLVCPVWDAPEAVEGELRIVLDPGVAFGSSHHSTTRMCIELMERAFSEAPPDEALDLGTGTGVLAIAAALLGARRVTAVDSNDLAARTAAKNVAMNGLDGVVDVRFGDAADFLGAPGGLLIANIYYNVLRDLSERPGFRGRRWYVLSGILSGDAEKLLEHLKSAGLEAVERKSEDGWSAFLLRERHKY